MKSSTLPNLNVAVDLLGRGVGILLQIYRLGGVNEWRSVDFTLNHVVRGIVNNWEEGVTKVLFLINGLCV